MINKLKNRKIILLLAIFFVTGPSLANKEIEEEIRKGSVEDISNLWSKVFVRNFCLELNDKANCFIESKDKNQSLECLDSVDVSDEYTNRLEEFLFLSEMISKEEKRRPEEFKIFNAKIENFTEEERNHFASDSYIDEAFLIFGPPLGGVSEGFDLWIENDIGDLIKECEVKIEEERFNCLREVVILKANLMKKRLSCSELLIH